MYFHILSKGGELLVPRVHVFIHFPTPARDRLERFPKFGGEPVFVSTLITGPAF
jgi:hypothetical protein